VTTSLASLIFLQPAGPAAHSPSYPCLLLHNFVPGCSCKLFACGFPEVLKAKHGLFCIIHAVVLQRWTRFHSQTTPSSGKASPPTRASTKMSSQTQPTLAPTLTALLSPRTSPRDEEKGCKEAVQRQQDEEGQAEEEEASRNQRLFRPVFYLRRRCNRDRLRQRYRR